MSDKVDHVVDEGRNKVDDECKKDKAKTVDEQEYGIRNELEYLGENGELAAVVGADVEHIEYVLLTVCPEHLLHYLVEKAGDGKQADEGEHAAGEVAEIVLMSLVRDEEDAESDLEAVMHHRVERHDEMSCKDSGRIEHNEQAADEGEERHISDKTVADLALGDKNDEGENPYDRRAELEGEAIPVCVEIERAVRENRRSDNHLVEHLEDDEDEPGYEEQNSHRAIRAVTEEYAEQNCKYNSQTEGDEVECAIGLGYFHLRTYEIVKINNVVIHCATPFLKIFGCFSSHNNAYRAQNQGFFQNFNNISLLYFPFFEKRPQKRKHFGCETDLPFPSAVIRTYQEPCYLLIS